jgi:hypothetical protein
MTLMCAEHHRTDPHSFTHNARVFCAALTGNEGGAAICLRAVNGVPGDARQSKPVPGGVIVHNAHSKPNALLPWPDGDLGWRDFTRDEFMFSLSMRDAERYLPSVTNMLTHG